jgi:hypothetical protein
LRTYTTHYISSPEWDLYDEEVEEWLNGAKWNYNILSVPDKYLITCAQNVAAYLFGDADTEGIDLEGL